LENPSYEKGKDGAISEKKKAIHINLGVIHVVFSDERWS
jgi:hypothetical protein